MLTTNKLDYLPSINFHLSEEGGGREAFREAMLFIPSLEKVSEISKKYLKINLY